jgi:hypothetical protein
MRCIAVDERQVLGDNGILNEVGYLTSGDDPSFVHDVSSTGHRSGKL